MMKLMTHVFLRTAPVTCATGAVMLAMTTPAMAQSGSETSRETGWEVAAGVGVLRKPIFPGAAENEVRPAPYLSINYRDRFFVRGPVIGANLFRFGRDDRFRLGVMMRITPEARWNESDDHSLRRLGEIKGGADAGIFGSYRGKSWFAELAATKGVVLREARREGRNEKTTRASGTAIEFGLGYAARLAPGVRWTAQANVRWADALRTRTYFGISDAQSAATGLPPYRPKAGIAGYGMTTTLDYAFAKRWSILGLARYERLAGDSRDSPIVAARGKTNQFSVGVFLGYRF